MSRSNMMASLKSIQVQETEHSYMNQPETSIHQNSSDQEMYQEGDGFDDVEDIYEADPQHTKETQLGKGASTFLKQQKQSPRSKSFNQQGTVEITNLDSFEESERKRKEGTIKIMVRESETAYVRYDEDKIPQRVGNTEVVVKQGMLKKRAVGKSKLGRSNWKDRYFRLTSTLLTYYVRDPRFGEAQAEKKGQVPLGAIRQVSEVIDSMNGYKSLPADVTAKTFVLQITFDEYTLYVQTQSPGELFAWKSQLEEFSESARANQRSMGYSQDWFFGSVSRVSAQETLLSENSRKGDFLVTQNASAPSNFSIAVKTGKKTIKSAPIAERNDSFQIRSSRKADNSVIANLCSTKFKTLPELIKAMMNGGPKSKNAKELFGCVLRRAAIKSTSLPIFARVEQTKEKMAHTLNTAGKLRGLSAEQSKSSTGPPLPTANANRRNTETSLSSEWQVGQVVSSDYVESKNFHVKVKPKVVTYNADRSWYHPEFSRVDAEDHLAMQPPGFFIIRNPSKGNGLSITLKTSDSYYNGQIEKVNEMLQLKSSPMKFSNVDEFVKYYSESASCPMPNTKGVLPLKLMLDEKHVDGFNSSEEEFTDDDEEEVLYDDVDDSGPDRRVVQTRWIEEMGNTDDFDGEGFEGFDDDLPPRPPPPRAGVQDSTWSANEINGWDSEDEEDFD